MSPDLAQALQITPQDIPFASTVTAWSPRVPTLLYPAVQGARLMTFQVFRERWKRFGQAAAKRSIIAVEAVRMARHGFVPEFTSPPRQLAPPVEPSWTEQQLPVMQEITQELVSSHIVEEVPAPSYSQAALQIAAL